MTQLNRLYIIILVLVLLFFGLNFVFFQTPLKPKLQAFNERRQEIGLIKIPDNACFSTRPFEKVPFYEIDFSVIAARAGVKKTICIPKRGLFSSDFVGEYDTYVLANDSTLIMFFDYYSDKPEYKLVIQEESIDLDSNTFFNLVNDIRLKIEFGTNSTK